MTSQDPASTRVSVKIPDSPRHDAWEKYCQELRGEVPPVPGEPLPSFEPLGAGGRRAQNPLAPVEQARRYYLNLLREKSKASLPDDLLRIQDEVRTAAQNAGVAVPDEPPSDPPDRAKASFDKLWKGHVKVLKRAKKDGKSYAGHRMRQEIGPLVDESPVLLMKAFLALETDHPDLVDTAILTTTAPTWRILLNTIEDPRIKAAAFAKVALLKPAQITNYDIYKLSSILFKKSGEGAYVPFLDDETMAGILGKAPWSFYSRVLEKIAWGQLIPPLITAWIDSIERLHPSAESLWKDLLVKTLENAKKAKYVGELIRVMSGNYDAHPHLKSAWESIQTQSQSEPVLQSGIDAAMAQLQLAPLGGQRGRRQP